MKKAMNIFAWILGILVLMLAIAWFGFLKPEPPPISQADRAAINLMPLPAELKLGKGAFVLDETLSHQFSGESGPRLERAAERFYAKLSDRTGIEFGGSHEATLILHCQEYTTDYPSLSDDESYSIQVNGNGIEVEAASSAGIFYALESLLQLIRQNEGRWEIPALSLSDRARYPWRGLMIDACRHWIPKEVILRNLEAMGCLKMNVFHWHLSEYQGFRVESKTFPLLHELGSGGHFYTQEEIREVIEYAADRGIRVIPEFDLPGHSTSWFVGYPELASAPGPYVLDSIFGVLLPVMDPTREEVYGFLDRFFGEMAALFPDPYMHIGGDEVNATHWNENPDIRSFMEARGLADAHALQAYFNLRLQKILAGHGKKMMGWDEIIHPDLPKEGIVVQTWRDHGSLWESARKGNEAVLSAGYYPDYKKPASYHYGIDPLSPEQEARLLGGEACMWSEMVDATTMESRIWPRAAAVAEKLWSPGVLSEDVEDMYRRLMIQDDLLEHLGLRHRSYRLKILKDLVPAPFLEAAMVLAEVLQEEEMFGRMAIYDPRLYTFTPLNRMVDAAAPESYQAYRFGQDVNLWLENQDEDARKRLVSVLETWAGNHEKLAPAFEGNEFLMEVEAHSRDLSVLAKLGLEALNDPAALRESKPMQEEFFRAASEAQGACILPLAAPVQKLVQSANSN